MSFRFMRLFAMFDLPTITSTDKKNYRDFRKFLLMTGFVQLQESVYTKIVLNKNAANAVKKQIQDHKPPEGKVCVLEVTEKQYSQMLILVGEVKSEMIDSADRIVYV